MDVVETVLLPHKGNMQRKSILFAGLLNFVNKPLFRLADRLSDDTPEGANIFPTIEARTLFIHG